VVKRLKVNVSRADVADFMIDQLASNTCLRTAVIWTRPFSI
jgi:hypothetical protein